MLRIMVIIEPGGDRSRAREIAELEVWNVSSLDPVSNYRFEANLEGRVVKSSVIDHERAAGWVPLVRRVLQAIELQGTAPPQGGEEP
jgi:hypothetical protein